mgnify:CR=1 FL=1
MTGEDAPPAVARAARGRGFGDRPAGAATSTRARRRRRRALEQIPTGGTEAKKGSKVHDRRRQVQPTSTPRAARPRRTRHGDHPVRVAVLAGGRSSEHDVVLSLGRVRARGAGRRRATTSPGWTGPRRQRGRARGEEVELRRRRRASLGADAPSSWPCTGPPLRRGRHRAGPARAARRRPTSAPGVLGQRAVHGQGPLQGRHGRARALPQVPYWSLGRRGGALAPSRARGQLPVLGQAGAAGLVGGHRARRRARARPGGGDRGGRRPRRRA